MNKSLVYRTLTASLLGAGLLLVGVSSCKKNNPDDSPGPLSPAQETARVNSKNPQDYLSGTFPAVFIQWGPGHIPHLEGVDWQEVPDPKGITGDYKLLVEAKGADSLSLYLDGSGTGDSFKKALIATVDFSQVSPVSNNAAGYRFTRWNPASGYTPPSGINVSIDRFAYETKTVIKYTLKIYQITQPGAADNGRLGFYVSKRYNLLQQREIGEFIFSRRSDGVIK